MTEFNPFSPEYNMTELDDAPDFTNSRIVMRKIDNNDEFRTHLDNTARENYQDTDLMDIETKSRRPTIESQDPMVISQQPSSSRMMIPVYTLPWSSIDQPSFLPITGLDFLTGVQEILIQQTVDDIMSPSTSSRHLIKVPNGETLYTTLENSSACQRTLFGSQRGFLMSLMDPTKQEAARFVREPGCVPGCFGCCLQEVKVYVPENDFFVGKVRQHWTLRTPSFSVIDENYNVIYVIVGPEDTYSCFVKDESTFTIMSRDNQARLGSIIRKWDNHLGDFMLHVRFPASGISEFYKALLLAAAILIEYMFFAGRRRAKGCFC